ncbi:hypothetical protein H2200_003450 [Cladophialophora chaetospira]|uniref:Uncharacterized protein n=1 Tax=Cladophialophora chaetospira TaxID=386627 RepID=A0AA38XHD3_9EURO|nr:hypothetical protein H2200_003450 [Cladophialophora chaetospira]
MHSIILVNARVMKLERFRFRRLGRSPTPYQTDAGLEDYLGSGVVLTAENQKEFLKIGWKVPLSAAGNDHDYENFEFYFHHYHQSCSNASATIRSCTHRHVCESMQLFMTGTREDCESALMQIVGPGSSTAQAAEIIEFIGRAVLMIELREWARTETLEDFVVRIMASRSTQKDDCRLARSFNARTFAKTAGINVQWTRDLGEHLEVKGNDSDIAIFHCVTVLALYQQSALGQIFPPGFLEETKRTLSLMIPTSADKPTRVWFKSEQRKRRIDPGCGECRHLKSSERHLGDFEYWKDRIIIAKEVLDEHQPRGILQVWRDNRNPVQWWTFWIALVVFALTIVACVEGALQVYKAYSPSK